ncbi:hypothetical protein Tco_0859791 [Tanacetum coccineum]|uniref:Uncharacterized protein n=1 Tax=Tanacetum coccineum TaxID=301880 RepID=A0ABQ5BH04_9ASTR
MLLWQANKKKIADFSQRHSLGKSAKGQNLETFPQRHVAGEITATVGTIPYQKILVGPLFAGDLSLGNVLPSTYPSTFSIDIRWGNFPPATCAKKVELLLGKHRML